MTEPIIDPEVLDDLLTGLPRTKITPATISQNTIDRWYREKAEFLAEITRLRNLLSAMEHADAPKTVELWQQYGEHWRGRAERAEVVLARKPAVIADALKAAAHDCDGNCGLTEEACEAANRIWWDGEHKPQQGDLITWIRGSTADVVVAALKGTS